VYSTNDVNFTIAKRAYDEKNWDLATGYFEKYIETEISRSVYPSREKKLMSAYLYAGFCSLKADRLEHTISHFEKGIVLARKLGEKAYLSVMLNNVGMQYQRVGKFKEAIDAHKESLKLDIEANNTKSVGVDYSNMGGAYLKWGDYAKALENFEKAREIHVKNNNGLRVAYRDIDIGEIYLRWGQLDRALEILNSAKKRLLSVEKNPSGALMLIAEIWLEKEDFAKAEENIKRALEYDQKAKKDSKLPERLNDLGLIYQKQKKYDDAIRAYEEALATARFRNDKDNISTILSNMGSLHYEQRNFEKAISFFQEAVDLKEELRRSAFGPIRREYLSSQIKTYKFLASCYMKTNRVAKSFEAIEAGRSKYLAEQIAGEDKEPEVLTLSQAQSLLGNDDVVLVYANADWREKILIAFTRTSVKGMILDDRSFLRDVINLTKGKSSSETQTQRGNLNFVVDKLLSKEAAGPTSDSDIFEIAINYYRNFLTKKVAEDQLSKMFYQLLINPVSSFIGSKQNIIISPDGLLNYLPFETLQANSGKYLIASKNIRYAQSLGVLDLLNQRNYSPNRKYMLAFGGSVYDEGTFREKMEIPDDEVLPEEQFDGPTKLDMSFLSMARTPSDLLLTESLRSELNQDPNQSMRATYKKLGITTMNNLPGTLYEVEQIEKVVPDIKAYTMFQSNEFYVKHLNKKKELSNFKVLHFATHGLTIPVLPELSAVVLSIYDNERSEDGFLRTEEINKLDIQADFVNLSACETGLGKIYGGEGVVGLTQSFLIAGANGLSVSLWSVDDRSTAIFMVEMYRKVNQQGMDYYQAIAQTKREFIEGKYGDYYSKPFFWAPFVYYGKTSN